MVFNKTEEQEKKYLQQIIGLIAAMINNTDRSVKEQVDTLQEYKEYLWSNKDIDPHEIRSMRESILNHFALGETIEFAPPGETPFAITPGVLYDEYMQPIEKAPHAQMTVYVPFDHAVPPMTIVRRKCHE